MKKYKVLKGHLVYKENTIIIDNNKYTVMPGGDSAKIYQLHKDGKFIDHVQDMCINELIEEGFIEEIKKVYEVGKYYKDPSSSEIFFIDEEKNMYGFDVDGSWLNDECFLIGEPLDDYMETTEQEFKDQLRQYADNNYIEGTVIKSLHGEYEHTIRTKTLNNVYNNGQWAEIIKKPICKLGDGSFLYEEDYKRGDVIIIQFSNNKNDYALLKVKCCSNKKIIGFEGRGISYYETTPLYHSTKWYIRRALTIKKATKKEVKHLERCEKAGKYVSRKEKKKYTDSDMIEFHKFSTAESTEYAKKDLKYWKKRGRNNG